MVPVKQVLMQKNQDIKFKKLEERYEESKKKLNTIINNMEQLDPTESEIKNQYRKLAKQYHPDRNKDSSEEKMAQINKAYEVLSDKKLKAEYDKFCKLL